MGSNHRKSKNSSNKKAQAALEFLTTYSWAFMVLLLMLGALMYFDVFNANKYIPEECNFGYNIVCEDWGLKQVSANTFNLSVKIRNNLEKAIVPTNISLYNNNGDYINNCAFSIYCPFTNTTADWIANASGSFTEIGSPKWSTGMSCTLSAYGCEDLTLSSSKNTWRTELSFKRATGSTEHTIKGRIFTKAIK